MPETSAIDLTSFVRDIPDFPKPGIVFKDIKLIEDSADESHASKFAARHAAVSLLHKIEIQFTGNLMAIRFLEDLESENDAVGVVEVWDEPGSLGTGASVSEIMDNKIALA